MRPALCGQVPCPLSADGPDIFATLEGVLYRHDRRIFTIDNTLESPANTSAPGLSASSCPSVVKTFLNKDSCVRQSSCSPVQYTSSLFTLNETIVQLWYTLSFTEVYVIKSLRLEDPTSDSPCGSAT